MSWQSVKSVLQKPAVQRLLLAAAGAALVHYLGPTKAAALDTLLRDALGAILGAAGPALGDKAGV